MSLLSASRRPVWSTALVTVAACAAGSVMAAGFALGCAQGATAEEDSFAAQTTEPTEPEPGPALPPSTTGDETAEPASTNDAGAPASDAGGTTTPPSTPSTKAAQGDVLVSEVMYDCSGTEPLCEWIEVHNLRTSPKSLSGLTLEDSGGRTHVIGAGVVVPAGGYVVLARNTNGATSAGVPSAKIAYAYGDGLAPSAGVLLSNGSTGSILLRDGNTDIARVAYGGWFATSGGSIQLKTLSSTQMNAKGSWCLSSTPWSGGSDYGTPGSAHNCP